jgi:hypothetical protein
MAAGEHKAMATDELSPYRHFIKHLSHVCMPWPPTSLNPAPVPICWPVAHLLRRCVCQPCHGPPPRRSGAPRRRPSKVFTPSSTSLPSMAAAVMASSPVAFHLRHPLVSALSSSPPTPSLPPPPPLTHGSPPGPVPATAAASASARRRGDSILSRAPTSRHALQRARLRRNGEN